MNKKLLLFCILIICINSIYPQNKPAQAQRGVPQQAKPAVPPAPKTLPYVLKKDYDVQVQEFSSKINSALGSSASVRREVASKFDSVNVLGEKMKKVEEILNSANFQIALTSDSLKTTRNSMEEFRKQTEVTLSKLQEKNNEYMLYFYVLLGISILFPIIVLVVMLKMNGKLRTAVKKQSEMIDSMLRKSLADVQKSNNEVKDEMNSMRMNLQGEIYSVSSDAKIKVMNLRDETESQFKNIISKIDLKMDKPIDEETLANEE